MAWASGWVWGKGLATSGSGWASGMGSLGWAWGWAWGWTWVSPWVSQWVSPWVFLWGSAWVTLWGWPTAWAMRMERLNLPLDVTSSSHIACTTGRDSVL